MEAMFIIGEENPAHLEHGLSMVNPLQELVNLRALLRFAPTMLTTAGFLHMAFKVRRSPSISRIRVRAPEAWSCTRSLAIRASGSARVRSVTSPAR